MDEEGKPGKLFNELFPNGTTLTKVHKFQSVNINHLKDAVKSDDPLILRETLIGVLWHFAIHEDRLIRFNEGIFEHMARAEKAEAEAARYRQVLEIIHQNINGDNFDGDSIVWCQTVLMTIEAYVKAALDSGEK